MCALASDRVPSTERTRPRVCGSGEVCRGCVCLSASWISQSQVSGCRWPICFIPSMPSSSCLWLVKGWGVGLYNYSSNTVQCTSLPIIVQGIGRRLLTFKADPSTSVLPFLRRLRRRRVIEKSPPPVLFRSGFETLAVEFAEWPFCDSWHKGRRYPCVNGNRVHTARRVICHYLQRRQ